MKTFHHPQKSRAKKKNLQKERFNKMFCTNK